jgi:uncharacterized hydantoinase/oxoprolinase family protein
MGGVIGLDVGGANTKAAWRDGDAGACCRGRSRSGATARARAVLREVVAAVAAGRRAAIALTMTAELSDAFRTKREGVHSCSTPRRRRSRPSCRR